MRAAAFVAAVPPFFLKAADNPEGLDISVFDGIRAALAADRPAFLSQFFANFFNVDVLGGRLISDEVVRLSWMIAAGASPKGSYDCVAAWGTDFRADLKKITVPTLVIHGDTDRIVPLAVSASRTHQLVKGSRLVVIKDGPHGLNATHADELNRALVELLS